MADLIAVTACPFPDEFTRAYAEAALWACVDENGDPLDAHYGFDNLAPETLCRMVEDCARFQAENAKDLCLLRDEGLAGHDFWLNRNRHGSGYWDEYDLPDDVAKRLSAAAIAAGEKDLYVGDDGRLYLS